MLRQCEVMTMLLMTMLQDLKKYPWCQHGKSSTCCMAG